MSAQVIRSTILLAEDDPNDVFLVTRMLKSFAPRFALQVLQDGEQAISYLNGDAPYGNRSIYPLPTLILLDIQLPKVNGLQVLRWIREHPVLRGLIVIMLTGSESQEHLRTAYDLHVNSFLMKSPLLGMPEVSKNVLNYWLQINQVPPPRAD